ncbi:MAG: hypothetical protein BLM47_05920 [Candidatus Reconcilbacillus cellulovorans]|uniref:Xylose isomerase-like TIM barrel domain-containing protein n=1 Tax=Candidatus Reconcilbacillus cellulovorans TaxID=1906605 RepID=A0A2A6E0V0_9BACL|nr:MAG: hypothetical protein BLM47_05920 [Candidatus Reconcilbacillus cellulovorans]
MIVGLGEWGLHERPIEEHCRLAEQFGFRYMELGIGGHYPGRIPGDADFARLREIRSCCERYGVRAPFICLQNDFTLADPEAVRREKERVLREVDMAAELGATHVRLFAGFERVENMTDERWKRMLDAFFEIDEKCGRHGMVIAIETHARTVRRGSGFVHEHTVTTERNALKRLMRELPARCGFNFDPGNLKATDPTVPLEEYAELLNEKINYCHLKDWKRIGDSWLPCAVGDDDIDWGRLFRAMKFNGVFLIEYERPEDVEDGIRRSLDHLRKIYPDLRTA